MSEAGATAEDRQEQLTKYRCAKREGDPRDTNSCGHRAGVCHHRLAQMCFHRTMENGASRDILSGNTATIKGPGMADMRPQLWNQVWLPPLLTESSLKEPSGDKHEELQW